MKNDALEITIKIHVDTARQLDKLAKSPAIGKPFKGTPQDERVRAVILHLVRSAADGVRRPGSWEREWLSPAFGDEWEE